MTVPDDRQPAEPQREQRQPVEFRDEDVPVDFRDDDGPVEFRDEDGPIDLLDEDPADSDPDRGASNP